MLHCGFSLINPPPITTTDEPELELTSTMEDDTDRSTVPPSSISTTTSTSTPSPPSRGASTSGSPTHLRATDRNEALLARNNVKETGIQRPLQQNQRVSDVGIRIRSKSVGALIESKRALGEPLKITIHGGSASAFHWRKHVAPVTRRVAHVKWTQRFVLFL